MALPNREECTGCGSCAAVCARDSIRMIADAEGFLYPQIDPATCVDCKKCERACPVLRPPAIGKVEQILAAHNTEEQVRKESSSGGVFTVLAEQVICNGGAVCAAVYNETFAVEHRIAFTVEELAPMRGAKYAQSHAGHLFPRLRQLLEGGTPVLFVGTPCQCAGLKAFLGREYPQLLLVDMICHGVPAPGVWSAYVDRRRQLDANGGKITAIDLRDKTTGWSRYAYSVTFRYCSGDSYSAAQWQDPYMRGFVADLYLRPSCSGCRFKGLHRCSDLTLGDCWGVWDTHPEFDDNRGTSLVLVQSGAGQHMWDTVGHRFAAVPFTPEAVEKCNPSAVSSGKPHPCRAEFFTRLRAGEPIEQLIPELLQPRVPRPGLVKRLLCRIKAALVGVKGKLSKKRGIDDA